MPPKKPPPTPQRVMWAAGGLLPSQKPNSMMRCHCRDIFDSHEPRGSYVRWGAHLCGQWASNLSGQL
jgi:hypothetical protein